MKLTEHIDLVMEITRFKREKGRDPKRGLSKMMEYIDEPEFRVPPSAVLSCKKVL